MMDRELTEKPAPRREQVERVKPSPKIEREAVEKPAPKRERVAPAKVRPANKQRGISNEQEKPK